MNELTFEGGINIAIKIPKGKYEETVSFYKHTLKLNVVEVPVENPTISRTHKLHFGPNTLWLDCVDNYTHSETWLEIKTSNLPDAVRHLEKEGTYTYDTLEKIPADKHWIMDPAGTVFLLGA